MKTMVIIALLAGTALAATKLTKADRLTDDEIKSLRACENKVKLAQDELLGLQTAIAKAHGIVPESHMEWSRTFVFDGDFVLCYFTD